MKTIIELKNASKKFKKGRKFYLKQALLEIFKSSEEDFYALHDINFKVQKGESLGIIGANGSGKSTLLKLIAGVVTPTKGSIRVEGKISPLIELGAGFHPELSGRDNIYLNGTILGLSKKEIDKKFDSIVNFAELGDFIDTPIKHYSSGMQLRLGFSIAVSTQPDILVVDEVLSVGDVSFGQKCLKLMRDFKSQGVTIILVSHNLQLIQEFCDRALFLEGGRVRYNGKPEVAVFHYLKDLSDKDGSITSDNKKTNKIISVEKVEILDVNEKKENLFKTDDKIIIRINFKVKKEILNPVFGVAIYKDDNIHITGPNTKSSRFVIGKLKKSGYIDYIIDSVPLLSGKYFVTAGIFDSSLSKAFDFLEKKAYFEILPIQENQNGLMKFKENWMLKGI